MKKLIFIPIIATLLLVANSANANHAWGKYHWNLSTTDTEANPLQLVSSLSSQWANSLVSASNDWNNSVIRNTIIPGGSNSDCNPINGKVAICNDEYGNNGWLGIASIWATRGKESHITQATVKLNDTYYTTGSGYDSDAWRTFVMCQEVGHTFGLDHQDENFSNTNLGTCMDYTNDPDGSVNSQLSNLHPNDHDYEMLTQIYAHLNSPNGGDGGSGGGGKGRGKPNNVGAGIDHNNPSTWGTAIAKDASGKYSLFKKDIGNGQEIITHVLWVQ